MKTILRNFLSVLRRFKMATLLNVAGLAVAFAAFIVILIQVNYERSFDRCHPTADRVYRLELTQAGTFGLILPRAFVESVIQSSPHIEAGSLIYPYNPAVYFSVVKNGQKIGYRELVQTCHPDIAKVFDFPIIKGDRDCLNDPEKVILPESVARKMFGDQPAVGKALHAEESVQSKDNREYTVGAVYKDFPGNTQMRNLIYTAIGETYQRDNFGASNYVCYLLLDNPESAQTVVDNFNANFDFSKIDKGEDTRIKLTPLTSIYYMNESQDGTIFRSGNKEVTMLLFFIALLIIIVAAINFTNFSTSLTPMRIKSINTQKVLGSPDAVLRRALLAEAAIISMISWLLSLFIVWILGRTEALPFVDANLAIVSNLPVILLTGVVALFTGIVAGLYPSWYVTSFPPALVLKGSFGLSPSGRKLRTVLISIQFIVSILLIIGASFVRLQNNYMRGYSLGFDKDQIAIVRLSGEIYNKSHDTYVNRLKEYSGIEDVAFAMEKVGSKDGYSTNGGYVKEKELHFFMIAVSQNFLRVMGIPVEEGRDFSPADELSEDFVYIFNHTAKMEVNMEAGDQVTSWKTGRIVGLTGDVKFTSLRSGENNIAFVTGNIPFPMTVSYIRLKAGTDIRSAVSHIRNTMADIDPSYPYDIEFYDEIFNELYHKEENLRSLITVFSILAIIISLVGVFGLVVFETQYRRKEIGVRKVHGATNMEILEMLNRSYIYIVLVCFALAVPVGYYGIKKWLESFAYKTPMYWWVYLLALLIVLVITVGTVTFQSWRASNANPVDSLKSE
ncbi:ABC transporter permease [Parabacteroides chongii]|uniref:ABC transporter permease n=1 Tax=Parabacteroides chongii TaxID=2685834 RepID=UPI00240D2E43|nr:ABC transporter permease [Parabacteroides chongii]WFE84274.1 ABC transporter permease [Parabacteroides chongii]